MKLIATRRMDEIGRIVLPMEVRRRLQIEPDNALDICVDDNGKIVIQKSEPSCRICGEENGVMEIAGKDIFICASCRQFIKEIEV